MRTSIFLCVLLAALAGGCEHSPMGLPTVKMSIGNRSYELEVANTRAAEEKGLMERDALPADHGMIFVFASERILDFWMKNTRFPLDIVFADADGRVVSIRQMKAYDLNTTSSIYPAKYAIELNNGQAAACGVKVGDKLAIPNKAANAGGA
jgi:hypothetical protein